MAEQQEKKPDEKTPILPSYFKADIAESAQEGYLPTFQEKKKKRFCCILFMLLVTIAAVVALIIALSVYFGTRKNNTPSLVESIKSEDLRQLLVELQQTSVDYGNSRSVLNGYNASAEFLMRKLRDNGYEPSTQYFIVPVFENQRPGEALFEVSLTNPSLVITFTEGTQFNVMTYSGSCSDCTGNLVEVLDEDIAQYGCGSDWNNINATGNIVLMFFNENKGNCNLYQKAFNAFTAEAKAVIFMRDDGDTNGPPASRVYNKTSTGEIDTVDIPAIGVTNSVGKQLQTFLQLSNLTVSIETFTTVTMANTYNVFARTKSGRNDSVIVIGSHLDSVPAGPGINDNGSGSMANLQIAIEIANLGLEPKNQVVFAWWGAEELGLLGSTYYVAQLTEEERDAIALNLNFDMIASPNYQRGIYNGSSADESIVNGSTTIQNLFIKYFENSGLTYEIIPFTGRSDYGPFMEANISAGGLMTGAEQQKTQEQYELFGGLLNAPLDPCYHQACDTVNNTDITVYEQMTQAAAYTLEVLMNEDDLKNFLENDV